MSVESELVGKIQVLLRDRYDGVGHDERRKLFEHYDKNGDGEIDAKELNRVLADAKIGNGATRGFWIQGVLVRFDANGNGTLCFDELEAILKDA
ncbi:MAG: Ca2+-binding EF-hand superfamily protein [Myxococcota bacterium]|jgi:Ca2+-binding EF-hand superfamily protein